MSRFAHLVGSIPRGSAEEAMAAALERLGPHLRWLPDGETGERQDWVVHIIDSFRRHPDLELVREGGWSDYDDIPRFRVRRGSALSAESLDSGTSPRSSRASPRSSSRAGVRRQDAAAGPAADGGLPCARHHEAGRRCTVRRPVRCAYDPLRALRLPADTEFIGGFVHEAHSLRAQQALRDHLDALVGESVAVATACGLGCRAVAPALATMERADVLCDDHGTQCRAARSLRRGRRSEAPAATAN